MSPEENKAIVRRHIDEVWNRNDPSKFDEFVAPDAVFHDLVAEGWAELDQMGTARQLGLMPGRMPRPLARAMVGGIRLRDRLARRRSRA